MIVCPFCQHKNPEGVSRCEACGRSVEHFVYRACPSCGALNPAQSLFCSRCLTELAPSVETEQPTETTVKPFEPLSLPPQRGQAEKRSEAKLEAKTATPPPIISEPDSEAPTAQEPFTEEQIEAEPEADEIIVEAEEIESPTLIEDVVASQEEKVFILRDYETVQVGQPEQPTQESPSHVGPRPTEKVSVEDVLGQAKPETTEEPLFMAPEVEDELATGPAPLPATTASPLESLAEVLPIEASVVVPHRATPLVRPQLTETEQFDAALFQQIAEEGAPLTEPIRTLAPRQVKLLPRIGRILLYCMVLVVALTPLFTRGRTKGWVQPRESVSALAQAIEELPSGATVLISFDYGPTYAGEMDPLALEVIHHLAQRSARMIVMSTQPSGVGVAERILRAVEQEAPALKYGERYIILGYLPGQEAGLRTLNENISAAFKVDHVEHHALADLAVTQGVASVRDLDQIIVLADSSATVRQWIEQVQSQSKVVTQALVTSRVEPLLTPYQQAGQLSNLVAGATGAIEYQRAVGEQALVSNQADSYAALLLLFLVVAVVTNIFYVSRKETNR